MEPLVVVSAALIAIVLAALVWRAGLRRGRTMAHEAASNNARGVASDLGGAVARATDARDDTSALAAGIGSGLIKLDGDLRVTAANELAHTILGRPAGSLLGKSTLEAFVDIHIEEFIQQAVALIAPTSREDFSIGRGRTCMVTVIPIPARGYWVLIRETSELTRLRRIRTEFVENLSHELRTPVTAIGLLSELLASDTVTPGSTSEKTRGRILQIESEAIHLGQMINELLDLARIESGEGMAMNDTIDLDAVVRSSVDRLQPFANQARVKIASHSIGTVPLGREGNATRLAQAIVNLLHNAIKFSPPESTVEVQTSQSPDEVRVTVVDHGVGISRADLDRIFERFYVADRARSKGGGTGLGLSIARHIVEAHGGTIQASSNLGEGSTFTIVLPRG